jgi:hypothetical protein
MNAANYHAFRDFRKNIDIKQKLKRGRLDRKIILPKEGFTYGKPNRPPTPIKDIINNNYGNIAEISIRNEYRNFIKKIRSYSNLSSNNKYYQVRKSMEERKKKIEEQKNKNELGEKSGTMSAKNNIKLYKMKMFMDVKSKVAENLKMFKSYRPKKRIKVDDKGKNSSGNNIDNMINKLQEEVKQKEENEIKNNETLPAIN